MPARSIKEKLDQAVLILKDESLPLQQRLSEAYLMHLIHIKAVDLPKDLVESFNDLMKPFAWQVEANKGPEIRPLFSETSQDRLLKLSQDILTFAERYNQSTGRK